MQHIQITSGRGIRTGMGGNKLKSEKGVRGNIDPVTTAVPLAVVLLLCISFTVCPEVSAGILMTIRGFLGDTLGIWYLAVGLAVLLISFWIAFSDIGKITLGEKGEGGGPAAGRGCPLSFPTTVLSP